MQITIRSTEHDRKTILTLLVIIVLHHLTDPRTTPHHMMLMNGGFNGRLSSGTRVNRDIKAQRRQTNCLQPDFRFIQYAYRFQKQRNGRLTAR